MVRACRVGVVLSIVLCASSAGAEDDDLDDEAGELELHGFASQGFLLTTGNNYLADTERGSFEFSEAGINVTRPLTDRLRTGMQLFARDLGPIGDYKAKLDWFYLDYQWQDWLGLRAGRVKLPFGLYNDSADIDAAHSFALLPQSVYPASNRDFLLAQTGVELYGYRELGAAGALDYRAYVGTIFLDLEPEPGSSIEVVDLTIPYVAGGRVLWEPPVEGLRVGGSAQALRLDTELIAGMPVTVRIPAILWAASAEYSREDLLLAAEYSRWHVRSESSDPMLFPDTSKVSERAYALAAYRARPWLQPGAYYSIYYPDVADRSGRDARQHDAAMTLRFDVNRHWIVKVEGHYMRGTADLESDLNDGTPQDELDNHWGLFVVKTTAYF
jgi:hypothetical protein